MRQPAGSGRPTAPHEKSITMRHFPEHTIPQLVDLERSYTWSVNSAIEGGNPEFAAGLADSYQHESDELARDIAAGCGERPAAA